MDFWLRLLGYPFLLAADDGGGGGGGGDDGGGDGDGDDGGAGDGDGGGDEMVQMTKAEADALRRETAEARRAAKRAKADADKATAEKTKADGNFEQAAKDAEKRAQDAEDRATRLERQTRVTAAASRLKFRDPSDAMRFLDEDDLDDDHSVERALKALARDKKYLVNSGGRSGGDINGDDGSGGGDDMDARIRRAAGRL